MSPIGRESIGSSFNGRKEVRKVVGYTDKPDLTDTGKKLVRLFNWCQSEDVSISKAVKELRKLFDVITESKERRNFFNNLVFMLQVKLCWPFKASMGVFAFWPVIFAFVLVVL